MSIYESRFMKELRYHMNVIDIKHYYFKVTNFQNTKNLYFM